MHRTPAQAAQLVILRQIVARQIAERHVLVCGKSDARRAIQNLRKIQGN